MVYAIAVFAPLVGAMISGLLGKAIGDRASMGASVLGMLIAAVCGPVAFFSFDEPGVIDLGTWIEAGKFHVDWALRYDTLSAAPFLGPLKMPCAEPPWGHLVAVDLKTDKVVWTFNGEAKPGLPRKLEGILGFM